jgi:endonuclease G
VTVEIGAARQGTYTGAPAVSPTGVDDIDIPVTEGVAEDYHDREGYKEDFLGEDNAVQLPKIVRDPNQIVEFEMGNKRDHVLRYQHFSVVMNRKRRMCFFSAVNIDGKRSRKSTRTTWRTDPRITNDLQIMYECYGNPPKFSRGHMTRREDPVWGTPSEAVLGNSDSMHVTNVTPQMQSFNAPIWLGLEDYALQNARQDKMRISVITGPVLLDSDPVKFGVKIPRSFWKVIVFVHDGTGKLTATGYSISQVDQIREQEFVFGGYDTYQQSLSWIEEKAGISFGSLTAHDPMVRGVETLHVPLDDFDRIRFSS